MALRLTFARRCVSKRFNSFSFTPNSDIFNLEDHERLQKMNEAAVPSKPDLSLVAPLYTEMTYPKDVLDLFFRPTFEDIAVTCLAKDSQLLGDSSYSLKSKSPVSQTKFLFAQLTTEWLDQINAQIYPLSEILSNASDLTYKSTAREEAIREQFVILVLQNYDNLDAFYQQFLASESGNDVTLENITQFLLSKVETAEQYLLVMKFLANNTHLINTLTSKDFIAYILDDLLRSTSVEKVDGFSLFLSEHMIEFQPNVLDELAPKTLNNLAYVTSASSDLSTAIKTMSLLVKHHQTSPLKATFDLFISRYCKLAQGQNFSKDKILEDLACLKVVFFHRGLDSNSLKLFLNKLVDNVHDLWHCIALTRAKSPELLSEFAADIVGKLQSVQNGSQTSNIVKRVQLMQLVKTLYQSGVMGSPEINLVLEKSFSELGLPAIRL